MKKKMFLSMPQFLSYLFPLLFIVLFTSCEKDTNVYPVEPADLHFKPDKAKKEKVNTFYGPAVPMGKGRIQALVKMTHSGIPQAIGVRFSEKVLEGLPHHMEGITLRLPNKASGLAFDHIDFGWNPEGHEPPGVYDLPHFDLHFYLISVEEKMQITNGNLAEILPPGEYVPQFYVPTPGFVPMMGKHWINVLSNEAQGKMFDQTFIYGSYNGEFIFYEPMITTAYLMEKTSKEYNISQPQMFAQTGYYYPTKYSINYDSTKKEYTVLLYGMVLR